MAGAEDQCGSIFCRCQWKSTGREISPGLESYFTVNFAVVLLVSEPDTPVKVMVYVPSGVLAGNRTPEIAYAVPLT